VTTEQGITEAVQPASGSSSETGHRKPALTDRIVDLCKRGLLPSPFSVADIRKHFGSDYEGSHIRTVLSNYCEGGYYDVKQGVAPPFRRVSRGKYACA
jgi:hypothetical protein